MSSNGIEEPRKHSATGDPSLDENPVDNTSSNINEEPREHSATADHSVGEDPVDDTSTSFGHSKVACVSFDSKSKELTLEQKFNPYNWDWDKSPRWIPYKLNTKYDGVDSEDDPIEALLKPVLERDTKQCDAWKEEVQNILIFAGLFSAVVTAFIIESYRKLQPDPNDQIISLLSRIADQISAPITNTSLPAATATSSMFIPSPSTVRVNIFWFISLVLSLTAALIGIISLQWLREHQLYEPGMNSIKVLAIFNARSDGLKRWYVPQIFTGLPLLLQTALVLFFVGLVEFLFAIRIEVAIPVAAAVAIPILFLVATTVLPTLQLYTLHLPHFLRVNDHVPAPCPYKSPQALILQRAATVSFAAFNLFARAFGAVWIPFVVIARAFARSGKPFYGKSAPFNSDYAHYQNFRDHLQNAAGHWRSMDAEWPAARTSYAMAIQTPPALCHLRWPYTGPIELTSFISFFDWVEGIKNVASRSDPTDREYTRHLYNTLQRIFELLPHGWNSSLEVASRDPEVGNALQVHLTALARIVSPYGHQQAQKLVELSRGDLNIVYYGFWAVLLDQVFGDQFGFYHEYINIQLFAHLKLTCLYLSGNAHELFLCSNLPGITPSFSLATRDSLSYHRSLYHKHNPFWMQHVSHIWTKTLENVIMDTRKTVPVHPFTRKCAGSSTARCPSNLHTESIIELTEYILFFQVSNDIQDTLRLLHGLCISKPNPVRERPFVLIIACAYINAVANFNQDDVNEFHILLDKICALCGSLDPTLDPRPPGKARQWRSMESAFDYIRSYDAESQSVLPESQHPNPSAAEKV